MSNSPVQLHQPLTRPTPLLYAAYCYGHVLPPSMREWVRHDLAGKGAAVRMVIRLTIPAILILSPMMLIPATPLVHAGMTLPILIPFVYFAIGLNRVYRRYRLQQHGLDPDLVEEPTRVRDADLPRAYAQRFGPR